MTHWLNLVEGCLCGHGCSATHMIIENSQVSHTPEDNNFLPSSSSCLPLATLDMAGPHEYLLNQGLNVLGFSLVRSYGSNYSCCTFLSTRLSWQDCLLFFSSLSHPYALCVLSFACFHVRHNFKCLDCLFVWVRDFIEDKELDAVKVWWILFLNSFCD